MPVFQGELENTKHPIEFFFLTTNKDSSSWGGEGEDDVEDGLYFLYDEDRLPLKLMPTYLQSWREPRAACSPELNRISVPIPHGTLFSSFFTVFFTIVKLYICGRWTAAAESFFFCQKEVRLFVLALNLGRLSDREANRLWHTQTWRVSRL